MAEIPDALIEQAAQALADVADDGCFDCEFCGGDPGPDDYCSCGEDRDYFRAHARAVLLAVAPAIEAQALRDAGREWAEGAWQDAYASFPVEDDVSSVRAADRWLNERADQINPKEDPDA